MHKLFQTTGYTRFHQIASTSGPELISNRLLKHLQLILIKSKQDSCQKTLSLRSNNHKVYEITYDWVQISRRIIEIVSETDSDRCNVLIAPKFIANLYCICLSEHKISAYADAVQICGNT